MSARTDYLGIGFFVHPLPLFAVLVLAINDHYLKYLYPGWLTGKLSDFCGLFFFPLFLCALILIAARATALNWNLLWSAIFLTDLVFVAVKLWPPATDLYLGILGAAGFPSRMVRDSSDLIALSVNALTVLHARRFIAVARKSNI